MTDPSPTDAALLGDRTDVAGSFGVFYRRHAQTIVRWCARRGLSAHDAADVTQDVFIAALNGRDAYDATRSPTAEAWLKGIAFNIVAGNYRQSARERAAHERFTSGGLTLTEQDVAEYAALRAELGAAIEHIADLPDDQREALIARRLCGAEYADMAVAADVTPQAMRRRVSRATKTLRGRMEGGP